MGGSQDNGTSVYSGGHWHEWLGTDGMECAVNQTNNQIIYGTSQFGTFYKSNTCGNNGGQNITQPGSGNWITPFVLHPDDPETIFVGLQNVRKTIDGMQSWTTISNLPGQKINNLVISKSNPSYLYTSKNSKIYRTKDGGNTWDNISSGLPNLFISYIAVHPSDPEKIAISFSGFTDGEKVYISNDAGVNWINYSYNLPNIPANCLVFDEYNNCPLYVGMDVGVYYIDNSLTEWEPFMTNLPNVIVNELEIQNSSKILRAGTFGRGLWQSPLHSNPLLANFIADKTLIPIGCSINYTNLSQGIPTAYLWTFEGGDPETSTEENPQNIVYNNQGSFDVTLIVTNETGNDTLKKENYITVSSTLYPETHFKASDTVICSSTVVDFTDSTLYCPVLWQWEFSPNTVTYTNGTNANFKNPSVIFDPGIYSVTLTTTNFVGANTLTKSDYIYSGGFDLPFTEDFESNSFNTKSWTIENSDNHKTWEIDSVGGSSFGNKAACLNFFNYIYLEQRDRLITPALNLSGYSNVSLLFDHAYAQNKNIKDSLIIKISADCGETWTRVFASGPDGIGTFATSPKTNYYFLPHTSEDWCGHGFGSDCNNINLSNWAGLPNVKIMFESFNYRGNNLYLDNIMVSNSVGIPDNATDESDINIIPNPSTGIFYVSLNNLSGETNITVLNIQGQKIFSEKIIINTEYFTKKIDLSSQPKGIYFIEFRNKNIVKDRKIILR